MKFVALRLRHEWLRWWRLILLCGWRCWLPLESEPKALRPANLQLVAPRTWFGSADASQLREAIDAYGGDQLVYLTTEFGKPFSEKGLSNWFKKRCVEAGLPHCSAHGLRKAGATIIAERGGTSKQLQAAYEWTTSKMADHYTRAADQARLADSAFDLLRIDDLPKRTGGAG